MKTGWQHDDNQTRKEFERLQTKSPVISGETESVEQVSPGSGSGGRAPQVVPPQKTYNVTSTDKTVVVTTDPNDQAITFDLSRPLTVSIDNDPILSEPTSIRYDTVKNIVFETGDNVTLTGYNDGSGVVVIRIAASGGGGGSYSWFLQANGGTSTEISDTETVNFTGSGIAVVSRTGNTIDVNVPAPDTYIWNLQVNSGATESVDDTDTVNFTGTGGITVSRSGLSVFIDGSALAYTYQWYLGVNGGPYEVVSNNFGVQFYGTGGITVSQVGLDVTIDGSGFGTMDDFDITDGVNSTTISDADVLTVTGTGGITVTVGPDSITIDGSGLAYSWFLQANSEASTEINNGEAANFTGTGGIVVSRTGNTITIDGSAIMGDDGYAWSLATNDDIGVDVPTTSEVRFTADFPIIIEQDGLTVHFRLDDTFMGGPGEDEVRTGYIEFDTTDTDYVSVTKPAYRYGVRKYVDIVHDFGLIDIHRYMLELNDVSLDPDGIPTYYRAGTGSMAGENLGNQLFRNIYHHSAVDGNTVRIWATQSRLKPTPMRFYYKIVRL